jgi:ribonuclease/clavin/mitogillin
MADSGHDSVDALYEQVRSVMPASSDGVMTTHPVSVAPGIRVLALRTPTLPPAAHTNAYLVGPERGPQALVDPGSPYPDQQSVLDTALEAERDAGRPLRMVLLTHHHGDHVGGAMATAARWGVPIAAHAATARRLAGRVEVAQTLAPDETIVLDDVAVTCVFTPGHAEGHLCYEIGGASIAGDMVAGIGTILIDPDEGDMALYLDSLRKLLARSATTLLPAHGSAIVDGPAKLREYLAHRDMREQRLVGALTAGPSTLAELTAAVYTDTPRPLWPLAERSLRAHLVKLAREGRAREVDAGRWSSG